MADNDDGWRGDAEFERSLDVDGLVRRAMSERGIPGEACDLIGRRFMFWTSYRKPSAGKVDICLGTVTGVEVWYTSQDGGETNAFLMLNVAGVRHEGEVISRIQVHDSRSPGTWSADAFCFHGFEANGEDIESDALGRLRLL